MKKNLLVMQALLLLPLISTSFLLSMDETTEKKFNTSTVKTDNQSTTTTASVTQNPIQEEEIVVDLTFINGEKKYPNKKKHSKNKYVEIFSKILEEIKNSPITLQSSTETTHSTLNQSTLATSKQLTKGLTGWMYSRSFYSTPEENIYNSLKENSFDPYNTTHLEYLEKAFSTFVENNNIKRILLMLQACQYNAEHMELNTRVMHDTHNYLEQITSTKEQETKVAITEKTAEFIAKSNNLIKEFQQEVTKRTNELQELFDQFRQSYNEKFTKEADYLRELKEAAIITHILAPHLKFASNETCSDEIKCLRDKATKKKTFMNQADVPLVCNDQFLLKKIGLDTSKTTVEQNTLDLLEKINTINKHMQEVKLLNS